jgi:uncharacterized protein YgbK (DUF1537 family)
MDTGTASIIAAIVTGSFAVLVAAINKFRKENKDDHAYVRGLLTMLYKSQNRIESKVERVDERLSNHLEFHASGKVLDNGGAIHQDGVEATGRLSS